MFVQKMKETGGGPEETIFWVANPGVKLGRTRLQKTMIIKLKKHAKASRLEATKDEQCKGIARSIKPFRGGKKCSNKLLRLAQRAKAQIKANAAYKVAGMKRRHADYDKARDRAEKTHYDDAKVTAAPFMRSKSALMKNEGAASHSVTVM